MKRKATHGVLILDSSGSMSSILNQAIEMFNNQVDQFRQGAALMAPGDRTTITYTTFGTNSRPVIHYIAEPVERVEKLTAQTYVPDGMTPMLDAVGMTCSRVERELLDSDDDYAVLVVIVSDGQENYSGKWQFEHKSDEPAWNEPKLAELIKRLQATGKFTFTYLGANQNLAEVSQRLSIPKGNIQGWQNTVAGAQLATQSLGGATARYMACRSAGATQLNDFYGDKAA